MILSHQHRFIFVKTKKTASSSVELALSSLCGPDDVITPLLDREEKFRQGRGAQNYLRGDAERERRGSTGLVIPLRGQDFYGHMKAREVVAIAPAEWANYFKAGFVRNPWDAHLSAFFWGRRKGGDRSPEAFRRHVVGGFDNGNAFQGIFLDGKVAVDFVGRFETLDADYRTMAGKMGCDSPPPLPRLKTGSRPPEGRDYRQYYDDASRELVAQKCAAAIEAFGYEF
jgi:hypothetical protein